MTSNNDAVWSLWGGKFETTRELLGMIQFLNNEETQFQQEIAKYSIYLQHGLSWANVAIKAAQDRITQIRDQIAYYTGLLRQYQAQGRAV